MEWIELIFKQKRERNYSFVWVGEGTGWWLELSLADLGKRGWFGRISLKKQVDESFDPKESAFLFLFLYTVEIHLSHAVLLYFFKSRDMTLN